MPDIADLAVKISADTTGLTSGLQSAQDQVEGAASSMSALGGIAGGALAGGLAIAAAGFAAVGAASAAALASWTALDDAADTLTLKLGPANEALGDMTQQVMDLYNSSAGLNSSTGAIAAQLGQVSQITGIVGPDLKDIAANVLYLQQAEGQAAGSTETFARAMQGWNVDGAAMAGIVDQQYAAFQKYGIGAGEMNQALLQAGGSLRAFGLSLDQAQGLMAEAYGAGVNVEKMLGALGIAAGKFAKDGIEASAGLREAFDQIKNVESPVKAAQLAVETFGAKAGPQLADAIRQGKVSLEGLQQGLGDTEGALKKAVEATMDFPEKLQLIGKAAQTALAPAGTAIANSLGKALDEAKPAIDGLVASVAGMAAKIAPAIEGAFGTAKDIIAPLAGAAAALAPNLERLEQAFGRLGAAIGGAFKLDGAAALTGWNDAVIVAAAWTQVLTDKLTELVNGAAAQVGPTLAVAGVAFQMIGDALQNNILPPLMTLIGPLQELNNNLMALNPITIALGTALQSLGMDLGNIDWTRAAKSVQAMYDTIVLYLGDIIQAANIGISALNQILGGDIQGGIAAFKNGMEDLRVDHQMKWAAIENHLQMSMVSTNSAIATGVTGWQVTLGAGLTGMVQQAATAAAQIREQMRLVQLGTQLGQAGGEGYNYSMGAMGEPHTTPPKVAPITASFNNVAAGYGNIGKAASAAGSAASGAKKSAEEMAKQSADALKSILDAVEKMKEFLDKGYAALVEGDAAGKLTALSENLFALGRTFTDQLAAASKGLSEDAIKAAQQGSQGISSAASALKSMVDLLPKMWEFSSTPAWAAVQASPALFTQMSGVLIDMGRVFYEQMAAASVGVEENAVKAAGLLAQGIQSAGSAISAVIGAVKAMWEMYASSLWDEVQANRALLLQMSAWLIDLGRDMFDQFAAAAGGVQEKAVQAAQLLSQGIQAATSAISSTLKLVTDMVAASADPDFMSAIGQARGFYLRIAAQLTSFGRDVFNAFASAAGGVKEKTVAAATLLSNGIKAASDGLKAAADSVKLLLGVASAPDMIDALGGASGTGTPMSRWVLGVAAMLAEFARTVTEEWGRIGGVLGSVTVAGAQRLTSGIEAVDKGIGATVSVLRVFRDDLQVLLDTQTQFPNPASLTRITEWFSNVALLIAQEWGRVGGWLGSISVAGAKSLSDGIDAVSKGVMATVAVLRAFVDDVRTLFAAAAQYPTPDSLRTIAEWFANVALIIASEWGRVGTWLSTAGQAGAKGLADGIDSAAKGIASTIGVLRMLVDDVNVLFQAAAQYPTPDSLRGIAEWFANIALIIASEWGRIGAVLSNQSQAGAKGLADGIDSAAKGTAAVVAALKSMVEGINWVWAQTTTFSAEGLRGLAEWFANIALILAQEWGRVGAWLSGPAVAGGQALATGIDNAAKGMQSVVDAMKLLAESGATVAKFAAAFPTADAVRAIVDRLAWVAEVMAAEWGNIGTRLSGPALAGAQALATGAGAVADGLSRTIEALKALTDWLKKPIELTPQITAAASTLADDFVALWNAVADALLRAGAPSEARTAAVKAWTEVSDFTSQALSMMDTLAKLADWLKKPITLTQNMQAAAATLAVEWTALWTAIANALAKIAPPNEDQAANVKAWSEVADFTSQALSMMDTLPKLSDWLKKPAELTSAMTVAAAQLAVEWTRLWTAIKVALDGIAPPAEAADANVKAWAGVADFTSQALGMIDVLPKLSDWLKKPTEYTSEMGTAAGHLAAVWTALWKSIKIALDGIQPPPEAEDANVKAWAGVADFTSQALSVMDTLPKLMEWLKKPTEYTSEMGTAAGHLAAVWTALWKQIKIALDGIAPPTEDEQANVKAWAAVADFSSQALGMMDALQKLSEWLKKPTEYTAAMGTAAATLATDWTRLWWAIQDALKSITPPTEAEEANVKAWSGVADFTGQALGMMDSIVKLADWVKKPSTLTQQMTAAAGVLAQEWTALWWAIQQALVSITPPTEDQQANTKAWASVADFTSQALGMIDTLQKLDEWLKKPLTLTSAMKTAAAQLAVEFTDLWKAIADALNGITAPTDVQEAAVKAWASVSDAFGMIGNTLDLVKKLVEFNIQKTVGDQTITTYGIPTVAQVKPLLDAAIAQAVMFLKAIVAAAESSDLKSSLDQAAQDATKALNDVASNAFSVINGVLGTLKALFEFKVENGPGMVNSGQGNYVYSQGSSTAGIPGAEAAGAKVTQLMAALKAILDGIKVGLASLPTDINTEQLNKVSGVMATVGSIIESIQKALPQVTASGAGQAMVAYFTAVAAGLTAFFADLGKIKAETTNAIVTQLSNLAEALTKIKAVGGLDTITFTLDIPDINAALAALVINPLHVPVVFDLPPATAGSGSGGTTTVNNNIAYNTSNVNISQSVPASVAAATAQTAIGMGALFASSPV